MASTSLPIDQRPEKVLREQTKLKGMAAIDEYLRNGYNAVDAWLSVYPNYSRKNASNEFARMKKNPFFARYLAEQRQILFDNMGIDKQRVIQEVASMAFTAKDDKDIPSNVKAKTLEMLYKMLQDDELAQKDSEITIGLEEDGDE